MKMLSNDKKESISASVIYVIFSRFKSFPEDATNNRNAPFHDAFLAAFKNKFEGKVSDIPIFISLASWFHGLNTTLGQHFFEKTAHTLSEGTKKEWKDLKISEEQEMNIGRIITDLKNGNVAPNLQRENELIFQNNNNLNRDCDNFTVDCYFEDESSIVAIEIKTVNPNSGGSKVEKEKILKAKTALKNKFANKSVYYYIAFPFDPLAADPTASNKELFMRNSVDMAKFYAQDEVLLADEFWNFLSDDTNTMQQLISIINSIATADFQDNFDFLNNPENKNSRREEYVTLLRRWSLFSEITLLENEEVLLEKIGHSKNLSRVFYQPMFKDGHYNINRAKKLLDLL